MPTTITRGEFLMTLPAGSALGPQIVKESIREILGRKNIRQFMQQLTEDTKTALERINSIKPRQRKDLPNQSTNALFSSEHHTIYNILHYIYTNLLNQTYATNDQTTIQKMHQCLRCANAFDPDIEPYKNSQYTIDAFLMSAESHLAQIVYNQGFVYNPQYTNQISTGEKPQYKLLLTQQAGGQKTFTSSEYQAIIEGEAVALDHYYHLSTGFQHPYTIVKTRGFKDGGQSISPLLNIIGRPVVGGENLSMYALNEGIHSLNAQAFHYEGNQEIIIGEQKVAYNLIDEYLSDVFTILFMPQEQTIARIAKRAREYTNNGHKPLTSTYAFSDPQLCRDLAQIIIDNNITIKGQYCQYTSQDLAAVFCKQGQLTTLVQKDRSLQGNTETIYANTSPEEEMLQKIIEAIVARADKVQRYYKSQADTYMQALFDQNTTPNDGQATQAAHRQK